MSIKNPTSSSLSSGDDRPIIDVSRKEELLYLINIPQQLSFFEKTFQSISCSCEMGSQVRIKNLLFLSRASCTSPVCTSKEC